MYLHAAHAQSMRAFSAVLALSQVELVTRVRELPGIGQYNPCVDLLFLRFGVCCS